MLKETAGNSSGQRSRPIRQYMEHESRETIQAVYLTLHTSGLDNFTFPLIESLWHRLNDMVRRLDRLPEASFKELVVIIGGLREARNELQLACFLFHLEEIQPVYRMLLRNRAVLRGRQILNKMLLVWPSAVAG